jgi:hypothetical protein
MELLRYGRIARCVLAGAHRAAATTAVKRRIAPNAVPEIVLGSLGRRNTALGAIALALDETGWLPVKRPRK